MPHDTTPLSNDVWTGRAHLVNEHTGEVVAYRMMIAASDDGVTHTIMPIGTSTEQHSFFTPSDASCPLFEWLWGAIRRVCPQRETA